MRVAVYARVSTTRQAQAQTIEQQLDRLREAAAGRGWELEEQHVYRDVGYSGANLSGPGLDRLRDHAALADLDLVLVTAPDRLARNYFHQMLLIDELAGHGCRVELLDRPMSDTRMTSCCCRSAERSRSTATSTCCERWSAAACAGCRVASARPEPTIAITCVTGAPNRCAPRRGSAAPPVTSSLTGSTSWSGLTCVRR